MALLDIDKLTTEKNLSETEEGRTSMAGFILINAMLDALERGCSGNEIADAMQIALDSLDDMASAALEAGSEGLTIECNHMLMTGMKLASEVVTGIPYTEK